MGLIERIRNWDLFSGKDRYTKTPIPQAQSVYLGKSATWQNVNGFETMLYSTTPELKAVIDKKAVLFSNGVYKHYRMSNSGKVELIENSPIVNRLENPNVLQSRNEWMENRVINQCLYGNDYTYALYGSRLADPKALWNLIPNRMIINRTGKIWDQLDIKGIISSYEYMNDDYTQNTIFNPRDIFHNKTPNPLDPLVGISPLEALQMPISNIRLAYGYRNVTMDELGALGFITAPKGDSMGPIPLTEEDRLQISKEYSKNYGIHEKQARIKIVNTPVEFIKTSPATKDMMLFEEITADKMAIIDEYGLNVNVFSSEKGSTYENAREGKKSAYQDSIIPYAEKDCFGLSVLLGLIEKVEWIELDYSHLECLQEDQVKKAEALQKKAFAYSKLKETGDFTSDNMRKIFTEFEL